MAATRMRRILTPGYVLYLLLLAGGALVAYRALAPSLRPLTVDDMASPEYRDDPETLMRKIDRDGLLHDLRPHAKATHEGISYATNNDGLRDDHDYTLVKAPGVRRVLMLGDSFVFGFGLPLEQTMVKQVMSLLDPTKWEVMSFGVPAYNTVHEVNFLEERGLKYHPDDVLLMYHPNDASIGVATPLGDEAATEKVILDFYSGTASEADRARVGAYLREQGWPEAPPWNVPGLESRDRNYLVHHFLPLYWTKVEEALDDLARLARAHRFRVHVAIIPELDRTWERHPFEGLYEKVRAEMRRRGFDVIDLYAVLRRYPNSDLMLWGHDGHTSAFANRILAHVLAEHLKALARPPD
jgi:hypothetical protein